MKPQKEQTLHNPFVVYGYKGPRYFCDREKETATVISALDNERNVTLVAPRRMGKSGLIHHVFNRLQEQGSEAKCFYMDILPTQSLAQFVSLLAETVIGRLDTPSQAVMKHIQAFFSGWRPTFTIDQITGMPVVSLDFKPEETQQTLRQIFEYMRLSGKRCYVAIDEFQQILNYKEKGVEALLRSYVQFLPNVYFVFSGSIQHVMQEMFTSAARPFFQSSQMLSLKPLDPTVYLDYANGWFAGQKRTMDEPTFRHVYDRFCGTTWYVQAVLSRLYEWCEKPITTEVADEAVAALTDEQENAFQNYCMWLTDNQLSLLRAIAQEGGVAEPMASAFMRKYGLSSPSSVRVALQNLLDKQLVAFADRAYRVADYLFSEWLRGQKA